MTKPEEIRYVCGACGEEVPYGKHCSSNPTGDAHSWDEKHKAFMCQKGHLYEELKP